MASSHPNRSDFLSIAVLAGGNSTERTVSLKSGEAVSRALSNRGHEVTSLDPTEVELTDCDWSAFDVAFLALHGTFGEDGQVQEILEDVGIPFTGSDSVASRVAFSKSASKERFLQSGVVTPPYVLIHETDSVSRIAQQAEELGFPLAVKPDAQGSSLGVSIVRTPDELPKALERCFYFDAFGLLEKAVAGTEWTVGMLDDRVLPVIQIETDREFFDYDAKYEDDATRYLLDFDLPDHVLQSIQDVALRAGQALGAHGLTRVDIRLDEGHRPWVLEVNTIPGLTDHSLVPKSAARLGMSLGELCERTIQNCLKSAAARQHSS